MDAQRRRGMRQREVKAGTKAIRDELRKIMDLKGWTDIDAAEACSDPERGWKITDSTINNYLHGYEFISRSKQPMIERGFGISVKRQVELMGMADEEDVAHELTIEDVIYEAERNLRLAREMLNRQRAAATSGR